MISFAKKTPRWFSSMRDLRLQTDIQTSCYFSIRMSRNIDNCATGNGVKKPKGGVDKQGDKPDQVLKLENIKLMGTAATTVH